MDMDNWLVVLQKVLLAAESPYVNVRRNSSITRPKQTFSGFLYLVSFKIMLNSVWISTCDPRLSMSCCVTDGQNLTVKVFTFIMTKQRYGPCIKLVH